MQNKNKIIDLGELYTVRVLVFMEKTPQSNEYFQVCLNREQFKEVSSAISRKLPDDDNLKKGFENCETVISDETYNLPDLQQIYEERSETPNTI